MATLTSRSQLSDSVRTRFILNRTRTADINICWPWTASLNNYGYGQLWVNSLNRCEGAHRISYVLYIDDIEDPDMKVLHKCDNRLCVNPNHLYLGTAQDNAIDMVEHGRSPTPFKAGEGHHNTTLTDEDVYLIREMIAFGYSDPQIANTLGIVSRRNVNRIRHKQRWTHIT